jgi:hypothetical protein
LRNNKLELNGEKKKVGERELEEKFYSSSAKQLTFNQHLVRGQSEVYCTEKGPGKRLDNDA